MKVLVLDSVEKLGAALITGGATSEAAGAKVPGYEWVNAAVTIVGVAILGWKVYANNKVNKDRLEWEKEEAKLDREERNGGS